MIIDGNMASLPITDDLSKDEVKAIQKKLEFYISQETDGELDIPDDIHLVLKDHDGKIVGGIIAGTTLKTMYISGLWIDEDYRRMRYGSKFMRKAEEIAKEIGCISGQTWVLSFQAPRFFERLGYEIFGISDVFPKGITEHYFIKRF